MPKEKTKSKPENAPQEKAGGDCPSAPCSPLVALYEWTCEECHTARRDREKWEGVGAEKMALRCEGKAAALQTVKRKLLAEIRAANV